VIPYEHALPYVVETSNDHALNGRALGGFDVIVFSFVIDIRRVICVIIIVDVLHDFATSVSALTWMTFSSCGPRLLRSGWRSHDAAGSVDGIRLVRR
jgi:hypothetical protein